MVSQYYRIIITSYDQYQVQLHYWKKLLNYK